MGGEGSMAAMILSLRNNRSLLSRNKHRKKEAFERLKDVEHIDKKELHFNKFSNAEFYSFKRELQREKRNKRIKLLLIFTVCSLLGLAMIYFMIKFIIS